MPLLSTCSATSRMPLPPLVLNPPALSPAVSPRAPVALRVASAAVPRSLVAPRPLVPCPPALLAVPRVVSPPVVPSPAVDSAMVVITAVTATVVRAVSHLEALGPLVASVALARVVRAALLLLLPPLVLLEALVARILASSLSPVLSLLARLPPSLAAPPLKAPSSLSVFTPARSAPSRSRFHLGSSALSGYFRCLV